jgi:energy-coupling factor transporter ATP-binding protein EcfA2
VLSYLDIENFRKFDRYRLEFGRRNLLVGPNNAGKSTVIEALRLVSIVINRLGNLNPVPAPEWLEDGKGGAGYFPSLRGLDFSLGRETFHQYAEPPAKISAQLISGGRIHVYVGPGGDVFATAQAPDGLPVTTKRDARLLGLQRVGIQPQVGPVSYIERELADRYVRGAIDSSLAPTHFRNQLRLLEGYFEDFKVAAERSWPGLALDRIEGVGLGTDRHLALFLRDGEFVGELAAMGHGLQMWLQLMWFLARAAGDATIVLDEPDVYMHPDLQRRLIRILFQRNQQVIVATHSVEMMAEVEPDELISIDSSDRKARPARKIADVQRVVDQIGGVHNIEFARLARAKQCLVMPAGDVRLLSRWYDLIASREHGALDLLPTFPCEGWGEWPYVIAYKRAIDQLRDEPMHMICLLPGGMVPEELFEAKRAEAKHEGIDLYIWRRRGLPSYAIDPYVIGRLLGSNPEDVRPAIVAAQLEAIADTLRDDARAYVALVRDTLAGTLDTDRWVTECWKSPDGRLSLIPGRLAILRVSAWANQLYGTKIGLRDLVAEFRTEDLDPEIQAVLSTIAAGKRVASIGNVEPARPWPLGEDQVANGAQQASVTEVLDLFEAAGLFD